MPRGAVIVEKAINQMFGRSDNRSFLKKKLLALLLTVGAIVFLVVVVALVAVAPAVFDSVNDLPGSRVLLDVNWAAKKLGPTIADIRQLVGRIQSNFAMCYT